MKFSVFQLDVVYTFICLFYFFAIFEFKLKMERNIMLIKNDEYLSFVEAQKLLNLSRTTIQKAVSIGKISYYKIGKKKMLSKKDLELFIDTFFFPKRSIQGRPKKLQN